MRSNVYEILLDMIRHGIYPLEIPVLADNSMTTFRALDDTGEERSAWVICSLTNCIAIFGFSDCIEGNYAKFRFGESQPNSEEISFYISKYLEHVEPCRNWDWSARGSEF